MTVGEHIGSLRRTLHRALARRLASQTQRPFQQLLALRVVAEGQVHTQADLADRLLVDAPAVSRLVAKLEAEGLLRRLPGKDRRCVKLEATPAARREARVLTQALNWMDGEIRESLTAKEVAEAVKLMGKIQRAFNVSSRDR